MNGHTISETYTPSGTAATAPPRPHASPPTPSRRHYSDHATTPTRHLMTQRPIVRESAGGWASEQEKKIKLQGLPKRYWTKDVYEAMSRYGNVISIEMKTGMRDNDAWVIFQYVDLAHDMSFY